MLLRTRWLNHWLHTHYTPEEVAGMNPLLFAVVAALEQGMEPRPATEEKS